MANCYFCACYIRNGEGYRRKVLVNESARVYFTKSGGGSYGQSYALRTLCRNCATELDKRNKSFAWRFLVSALIAFISMIIAVRSRGSLDGLAFLFFFIGGPGFIAFMLLGLLENSRHQQQSHTEKSEDNIFHPIQEVEQQESVGGLAALEKKVYEADLLKNAETPEQRRGLEILFKFIMNNEGRELNSGDDFANMVINYSQKSSLEEAKEFIALLGRGKEEDINIWFTRASKLAPHEISTEDATAWLTYVYKMAITLKVDLWFGLDEGEEQKIKDQVLASI